MSQKQVNFFIKKLKQNTSKLKNQKLNCKTIDLGGDHYNILKDSFRLYMGEFSETSPSRRR